MRLIISEDTIAVRVANEEETEAIKDSVNDLGLVLYNRRAHLVIEGKDSNLYNLLVVLSQHYDIEII